MADERISNPIPTSELDRRWTMVRAAMRDVNVDELVIQRSNNFSVVGGYFRWFTGIPASGTYPLTVIFPADGPMTIVHHSDFGGEVRSDPSNPANYGIARRVLTPS